MLPIGELMRHEIAVVSPDAPVRRVVEVRGDLVKRLLLPQPLGRPAGK